MQDRTGDDAHTNRNFWCEFPHALPKACRQCECGHLKSQDHHRCCEILRYDEMRVISIMADDF